MPEEPIRKCCKFYWKFFPLKVVFNAALPKSKGILKQGLVLFDITMRGVGNSVPCVLEFADGLQLTQTARLLKGNHSKII